MTEPVETPPTANLPAWELLRRTAGAGLMLGTIAIAMVPAWVCLVGMVPSAIAAVALMRAQLRLALPTSQPVDVNGTGIGNRWVHAGVWVIVGVGGYIAAVACASALSRHVTERDPSTDPAGAALTLTLAAAYCLAVTPFAFVPIVILDVRRPHALTDVLVTSVGIATRDLVPLLGGAVLAGLMLGLPTWLAVAYGNVGWALVWLLAPWLTSGMMVHRYARLSATLPMDPREGALPITGVALLGVWAVMATAVMVGMTHPGITEGWIVGAQLSALLAVFVVLGVAWVAMAFVLARIWSRARAARWVLTGRGAETSAFTGELQFEDGAALVPTRRGLRVEGSVWVVGREARVQLPPGLHPAPHALEVRADALAAGATLTVVGTFRTLAQPGLRAASLDWPRGAALLVGDYREATATLARRATRWTIVLLLPIMMLATVTAGALMIESPWDYTNREGDW